MKDRDKERIVALQAMLRVAREALQKIACGSQESAYVVAEMALEKMDDIQTKKLGWRVELPNERPLMRRS